MVCFGYDYATPPRGGGRASAWVGVACGARFCCGCRESGAVECFGQGAVRPPAGVRCDAGMSAGGAVGLLRGTPFACALVSAAGLTSPGVASAPLESAKLMCWGDVALSVPGTLPQLDVSLPCGRGSAGWGGRGGACTACAPGSFACGGFSRCEPCPVGTAVNASGAHHCPPCPEGTASGTTGAAIVCSACGAGRYSGARAGACAPCGRGFVSDGRVPCAPCSVGAAPDAAAAACVNCAAGSFAGAGALACAPCARGTISTVAGSGACEACPGDLTSSSDGTECVPESPFFVSAVLSLLVGAGALLCLGRCRQAPVPPGPPPRVIGGAPRPGEVSGASPPPPACAAPSCTGIRECMFAFVCVHAPCVTARWRRCRRRREWRRGDSAPPAVAAADVREL